MSEVIPKPIAPGPLVVGLGEVLFDCFPDRAVLGGAPFNVAVHADALLRATGGAGVPVSRVGADALGERFAGATRQRGLDARYVQRDSARSTGRVEVTLGPAGDARYEFAADTAWDALEYDDLLEELAGRCDAIAFGTLAQRGPTSRTAITRFVARATQAVRLLDVNLRAPYYSPEVLESSFRLASAAKLNEEELRVVGSLLGLSSAGGWDADQAALELSANYKLDWLALTGGSRGAWLYQGGEKHFGEPAPFDPQCGADPVGAGDACCAGLLCGKLLELSTDETLRLANRLGAYVAARTGATPRLPDDFLSLRQSADAAAGDSLGSQSPSDRDRRRPV